MDRAILKAIEANKSLMLSELEKADPKVFAAVTGEVAGNNKALVDDAMRYAPLAAQRALASLKQTDFLGDLHGAVERTLKTADMPAVEREEALSRLAFLDAANLDRGADPKTPVGLNPTVRAALARAELTDMAEGLRLKPEIVSALSARMADLNAVDDETLEELVGAKALNEKEARVLGLNVSLFHLAGGEPKAATALANARFDALKGGIASVKDILALSAEEIAKVLKDAKVPAPDGANLDELAESILRRVAEQHPLEAMQKMFGGVDAKALTEGAKTAAALADRNTSLFSRNFEALDAKAIPAGSRRAAAKGYDDLARVVRRYPGLGLEKIASRSAGTASIGKDIVNRIALVDTMLAQNPDVEFLALDYAAGSDDLKALKTSGISPDDQKAVFSTLKAQQRVFALMGDPRETVNLLEAGYASATSIARDDIEVFAEKSKLPIEKAREVHQKATGALAMVSATVGSMIDIMKGGFAGMLVGNIFEDITDGLRQIEGYADLFGSQDTCDCDHCQSILSPAAYFVDMMHFVEETVTSKVFVGAKADHALKLSVRRPDLWTLPLTCANTNTLIPTLDVANEILESYIAKRKAPAIDVGDRAEVRKLVYGDLLGSEKASFQMPFALPTAQADAYIEPFGQTRAGLLRAAGLGKTARETAAHLKLSTAEYAVIVTPDLGWPYLRSLFQFNFTVPGSGIADPVDVQELLPFTGLTRAEFGAIAETRTITADGARAIAIKPAKRSASSVQNDVERISGLTADGLDAFQRFVRLWRKLRWTIAELDLVLKQRKAAGAATIDAAGLDDIVAVLRLVDRFGLAVEEALALWSALPRVELVAGRRSLFDRLFNNRPYTLTEGLLPKDAVSFVHPAFRASATPLPEDNTLHRILIGLQLSEAGLGELITALAVPLGANLAAANQDQRGFTLTAANLTLLYRHAKLMKLLRRTAGELSTVIALAGIAGGAVRSLADVEKLVVFDDWVRASGYSLDDVLYVTGGTVSALAAYPTAAELAAAIVDQVATEGALLFADTVFAFVPGVTENMSKEIVAANAGLFEAQPQEMLRLKAATSLAPAVAIPAGVPASLADLQAAVARYHTAIVLPARVASKLASTVEKLKALTTMAGVDLGTLAMATALQGGARAGFEAAMAKLAKLAILFKPAAFTPQRLAFLDARRAMFGIADFATVTIAALRAVGAYRNLFSPNPPVSIEDEPDALAVEQSLTAFTAAQKFAAVPADLLGQALGVRTPVATTLASFATLGNEPLAALGTLAALARSSRESGIGADAIKLLVSEEPAVLDRGAEALVSTLRQLYPDDASFNAQLEPLDDRLRSMKRDALGDYLIRKSAKRFTSLTDLYDYFLIDVQFQGCARTSRVVAAISSLQTYLHRILLNLEQDRREPNEADHVHVLPSLVPEDEWSWRKNYRVWEANRKVFLWPENYIEPELRDDKTPLFQALEDKLLQQDITEQNVLDAYGEYLDGFGRVADLKIAGAFHELSHSTKTDVLHVFGCTPDDPPAYYYWTISNLYYSKFYPDQQVSFSARRKIEVTIAARTVSPIVHMGRLHLFWVEIATSSDNRVEDGESKFVGYRHKLGVKFTWLRLDGAWTPPQSLEIREYYPVRSGGTVKDQLTVKAGSYYYGVPYFSPDITTHGEYREGYTLRGFPWERIYPAVYGSQLYTNFANTFALSEADLFDRKQREVSANTSLVLKHAWTFNRQFLHVGQGDSRRLYAPTIKPDIGWGLVWSPYQTQAVVADIDSFEDFIVGCGMSPDMMSIYVNRLKFDAPNLGPSISTLRDPSAVASAVNGAPGGAGLILQSSKDSTYVFKTKGSNAWESRRLGTTIVREMARTLFTGGINELLDLSTQKRLREAEHMLTDTVPLTLKGRVGAIDFGGPLGVYYKEIYFHIPFLLADQLNSRQNFAAAQAWFHYVFDPTATLDPGVSLAGLSAGQKQKVLRDRVWRYIEFRNLTPPKMRDILTDEAAIKAYKEDPFNPHAIARLRISAYQKSVVMKYVANLIDWGDSLFSQFTMESVNEALVLYVMASEILGRRPADVGDCGEGAVTPKTYEKIRPTLEKGSEFLMEVESIFWVGPKAKTLGRAPVKKGTKTRYVDFVRQAGEIQLKEVMTSARIMAESKVVIKPRPGPGPMPEERWTGVQAQGQGLVRGREATTRSDERLMAMSASGPGPAIRERAPREEAGDVKAFRETIGANASAMMAEIGGRDIAPGLRAEMDRALVDDTPAVSRQADWKKTRAVGWVGTKGAARRVVGNDAIIINDFRRVGRFGWSVVRQLGPVFCVPQNKDLVALWDRVDDRLYKIRHCLDINGERRDLSLFAPEIDPRMLVRARAEGLSLDDILGATSGNLPPYRFAYLIEKARQYVGQLQNFGSQLFSALERRDMEELTRLRNSQQLNMLRLNTKMREWDLKLAEGAVAQLELQRAAVEYRRDYYDGLLETDLLPWERTQQVLRHSSTAFYTLGAAMSGTAGVLHLIPQLGSPFAMKYGGKETGDSLGKWGAMFSDTAKMLDVFGASAGLEASFERRREGWEHQSDLADHELKQIEKQIKAAAIRRDMAEKAIELHKTSIEDEEEIIDFFEEKFSNLGLYTWMASTMQRLYRQSFNSAQAMSKLAERAYRFERGDETTPLLQMTYWDASHAGLLAGERLMADLNDMEKRFIETNYRTLEIDQSFSAMQLAPAELLKLRQTGECEIEIPEFAFNLSYPGHYRRRIKAARLTIPCVTGPYTNIAATLTLKQSFVRKDPKMGAGELKEMPLRHTNAVATSTAQNDAGVFDFSFRDERYMPFEGAGAVSVWTITLPKSFRPFDYQSINDAIIHISYTALSDGLLRQKVEDMNAALDGTIVNALTNTPMARALSLRQDYSSTFQRLLNSAPATQVVLEVDERALPLALRGRPLTVARALLLLRGGNGAVGAGAAVKINGTTFNTFQNNAEFPGYRSANIQSALATGFLGKHTLSLDLAGDFAPNPPSPGDPAAANATRLLDAVIYVELTL